MKKQNKIILLGMLAIILFWITIVEINNLLDGGLHDTSIDSDKSNIFSNIFGPEDEISGSSIDLDTNLSPSYAIDFPFGWKSIFVFVPLMSGIIAAVLLGIHFILKKKNIRSRPYITIIAAAIMLYFGIQTLLMLGTIVIFLQQESPWRYLDQIVALFAYPIIGFSLIGLGIIFLYKSQLVRRLIQK